MTAIDQFDPFAGRVSAALGEIAPASRPAYLDDVLAQTAATRQRPRWAFPGRWLPMDTALPATRGLARVPARPLLILSILLLLAIGATVVWVGSQTRVPPPFGPAANGRIVYSHAGDLWTRDTLDGAERLLYAADGNQNAPAFSPDGQWLAFVSTRKDGDHFSVVRADGSNPREVALVPAGGNAQSAWRPDSAAIALIYEVNSRPRLSIASLDGKPPLDVVLGDLEPLEVAWRPPDGSELLVRVQDANDATDLLLMRPDGSDIRRLHLPYPASGFGPWFTNSGPVWSPDGSTIAYNAVVPDPASDVGLFRVHLVDPDGSHDRELPGPPPDPGGLVIHENWPQYSPDGRSILVHRWHVAGQPGAKGWLAVMPADGSAPARDIGPKISGGSDTGLTKLWSPDGTRVLMRTENTTTAYSIDPLTGRYEPLDWTHDLPDWQRLATR